MSYLRLPGKNERQPDPRNLFEKIDQIRPSPILPRLMACRPVNSRVREKAMNPEDLAKEIARRKQTAKDLKLRELVWKLYGSFFQYYTQSLAKEPATILPSLRESLAIKDSRYSFNINGVQYEIAYKQGEEEREGRRFRDETITTPIQLSLEQGCRLVFEFKMKKTVMNGHDGPLFSEYFEDVTAFIEGPWVQEFTAFVQEVDEYRRKYWAERNAERQAQKAESERKSFWALARVLPASSMSHDGELQSIAQASPIPLNSTGRSLTRC